MDTLTNDTIINLYKIAELFYNTFSTNICITRPDFTYKYSLTKYFCIRNSLMYVFVDSGKFYLKGEEYLKSGIRVNLTNKRNIFDFRPRVYLKDHAILYQDDIYINILINFLGKVTDKKRDKRNTYRNKEKFLNNDIIVRYGMVLPDYLLPNDFISEPDIDVVYLNPNLKQAKVAFTYSQSYWSMYLEKQGNDWIVIWCEMTGIS